MALHWDTREIANYETLCFIGEGDDRRVNPLTESIIWATIYLDCVPRTEAEAREFFYRAQLHARLREPTFHDGEQFRPFTAEEVFSHIGLSVNVGYKPRAEWLAHWMKEYDREAFTSWDKLEATKPLKDLPVLRGEKGDFKDCPECKEKNGYQISENYCPHCGFEEDEADD